MAGVDGIDIPGKILDFLNGLPNSHHDLARDLTQKGRRFALPNAEAGIGDVFVYEARRAAIQARFTEVLDRDAEGWGTRRTPISVVGHSLGGIIAFDAAVATVPPTFIKRFITFGSQSAALHILDPRTQLGRDGRPRPGVPSISRFEPPERVRLPVTIGSWTNVWEEMDPLALRADGVFALADGSRPMERMLAHRRGVTWADAHGSYWTDPTFHALVAEALV